ncbi:hypothetical protein BJ878DRAFT_541379 [Calycina marina]|uniref:Clr5 domain-containing protein n=1 Tax=Calycina marina TaxID=1763456 RepID=A0A9P7Z4C8_9HELO|nr:hypothetical protein BJ878DRAFT_541379 [Calycina marina]
MDDILIMEDDEDYEMTDEALPIPTYPPTRSDWNAYRSTFTQLYWVEDKTLPEVIEIMKVQYDFKATKRMYGQRITEWGLKKNRSAAEREEIARIVSEYRSRGEEAPATLVNNRAVSLPRRSRSSSTGTMASSGTMGSILLTNDLGAIDAPGTMICSPRRGSATWSRVSGGSRTSHDSPSRPIPSPTRLKWVEMIIFQANIFYENDVHKRLLTNSQGSMEIVYPEAEPRTVYTTDFINMNRGAIEAIVGTNPRTGWRMLSEAMDMLGPLFKSKSTYVISDLLDCASLWPDDAPPEISRAVWRHIADMAATILGPTEPTAMVCNALTHLESRDEIYDATQNSLKLILRKFEQYLGPDVPAAISTKAKYTRLLVERGKLVEAEELQREIVQQRQRTYRGGQNVTLAIYRLANLLRQKKDFAGAEKEFLDALKRSREDVADDLKDRNTGTVNVALSMSIVIDLLALLKEEGREEPELSQKLLEEALERCCKHCEFFVDWEKCATYLVDFIPVLDDVLMRQGKVDEAAALRARFPEYISNDDKSS